MHRAALLFALLVPSLAHAAPKDPPMYPKAEPDGEVGGVVGDSKWVHEEIWTSKDPVATVRAWFTAAHLKGYVLSPGGDGSNDKPFHVHDKAAHLEYVYAIDKRDDETWIDVTTRKD